MQIDVITIFPDYLRALDLSLLGKAQAAGLVNLTVHDLRGWTDDPHRTVDDAPFGGGAGMVMRPDVWGKALDATLAHPGVGRVVLALPTPAGIPLTQAIAADLASCSQLVIGCGRYEGIDARVAEHYRAAGVEVVEFSIGDFVLNGGEVAALALIEALGRLIPGVVGNPESLVEESHGAAGLLEYPSYTRPAAWRGLEVPAVLTSGNHAAIARWRRDQAIERTAARRPDMLSGPEWTAADRDALARAGYVHCEGELRPLTIRSALPAEVPQVAELARLTFPLAAPPDLSPSDLEGFIAANLTDSHFEEYLASARYLLLVAEVAGQIVGYTLSVLPESPAEAPYAPDVAACVGERPCAELSKIYVRQDMLSTGVASGLMAATLQRLAGSEVGGQCLQAVWLGTNARNKRAQRFYRRWGFSKRGTRRFQVGERDMNDAVWAHLLVEYRGTNVAN